GGNPNTWEVVNGLVLIVSHKDGVDLKSCKRTTTGAWKMDIGRNTSTPSPTSRAWVKVGVKQLDTWQLAVGGEGCKRIDNKQYLCLTIGIISCNSTPDFKSGGFAGGLNNDGDELGGCDRVWLVNGGFNDGGGARVREETFSGGRGSELMSGDFEKHSGVRR
ncbi:hypothetical protein L195_g053629, partial [Trifolium pratense]